jgi:hypothetical protein
VKLYVYELIVQAQSGGLIVSNIGFPLLLIVSIFDSPLMLPWKAYDYLSYFVQLHVLYYKTLTLF